MVENSIDPKSLENVDNCYNKLVGSTLSDEDSAQYKLTAVHLHLTQKIVGLTTFQFSFCVILASPCSLLCILEYAHLLSFEKR